ncbi:DoxX family protein [Mycolicibacterium sp. CBM1]
MPTTTTESARPASQLPAYRTAAMLIGIGLGHFVAPKPFDTIVPAELPGDPRFYTYASGVAEVGIGTMLLVPRTRRAGALAAIALYLAVFPANINMCRLWWGKPLPMKLASLARLPLQIPMIVQAVAIRRNAPRY